MNMTLFGTQGLCGWEAIGVLDSNPIWIRPHHKKEKDTDSQEDSQIRTEMKAAMWRGKDRGDTHARIFWATRKKLKELRLGPLSPPTGYRNQYDQYLSWNF